MASTKEKLAASLRELKRYQESHPNLIVRGQKELGTTHTRRLLDNGYLTTVMKGWYIPTFPGCEGDTTVWYSFYWSFVAEYANSRFGTRWSLSAEESLSRYAGETVAPTQLIVRAQGGGNNIIPLPYGSSLLVLNAALPTEAAVEPLHGLRLYSLAEALVFCSPQFFKKEPLNVRTCLYSLASSDEIIRIVTIKGNSSRAARIVGALRSVGRNEFADNIEKTMKRLGYDIRPKNPFEEGATTELPQNTSPHAARITLMWQEMRRQIVEMGIPTGRNTSREEILDNIEANYIKDSYHSLSIEGYRVTEGLIEQVRLGEWDPTKNEQDQERKNALAARGYFQAFCAVKKSVAEILDGAPAGSVATREHDNWHFELFQPCAVAGITTVTDLIGYRTHQVYIHGSRHTPFNPDSVRNAMPALRDCLAKEENAFVRAVLGHFFLAHIHPYMDGNGRTARFVMNAMLVTGGYPWTTVPFERRTEYMEALEKASTEGDIRRFAAFIAGLLDERV